MTTPDELHAATLALIKTIPGMTVFDGDVPTTLLRDGAGRVYPYVVLWPSAGYRPNEIADDLAGTPDGTLEWPFQVTVASGDVMWTLGAVRVVRAKLAGAWLTPRTGRLREDPGAPNIARDPDVTPARFFVPLLFRTQGA